VLVDVSLREESVATRRELVTAIYDDGRPFVAIVLTPEHLFAEKMRALLVRAKPRDLYDLWLMSRQGWRLDRNILSQKLALYDLKYTTERLTETVARVAADWERDMRPLLPQYIPFEDVSRVVQALEL
jgi:predicted nucleotidyltransferase component of viral defense system